MSLSQRFQIRFDDWYRVLSKIFLLPPSSACVEVKDDQVSVQMGWAFRCTFPKTAVVSATERQIRTLSRGVHGFAGRWLVNGSSQGILAIDLTPIQRGYVMGFPVRIRQLLVSVEDPSALATTLRNG